MRCLGDLLQNLDFRPYEHQRQCQKQKHYYYQYYLLEEESVLPVVGIGFQIIQRYCIGLYFAYVKNVLQHLICNIAVQFFFVFSESVEHAKLHLLIVLSAF